MLTLIAQAATVTEFERLLDKYGLPLMVLGLVGIAIWKAWKWFQAKVAEPLVTSHIDVINTVKLNDTIIARTMESQTALLTDHANLLTEIVAVQRNQDQMLKKIEEQIAQRKPRNEP